MALAIVEAVLNVQHDQYRVGPSPQGRAAFERYISAFNAGEADLFTRFYAPDARIKVGARVFNGPKEIKAFYERMYEKVREYLEVHQMVIDETGAATHVTATFIAHEDAPDFLPVPLAKGDKISTKCIVLYRLSEGKMVNVRVTTVEPVWTLEKKHSVI